MPLANTIADIWKRFQGELFPNLTQDLGPLTANHQRFVAVLDLKPVEAFIQTHSSGRGRPLEDRRALARSFIAKAVWDLPTTRALIDRLQCDPKMRRLCGWERVGEIPSESTFSRAFAEFAEMALPERMHVALIASGYSQRAIAHAMNRSPATISRELRRNSGDRGYRHQQAERQAQARRRQASSRPWKLTAGLWTLIEGCLRLAWSPEQIAGRLRVDGVVSVSPERIYQHVRLDRKQGGDLWRSLRRRGKKPNVTAGRDSEPMAFG